MAAESLDRVLSAPCGVCGEPATGLVNGAGFTPMATTPRWEPRCDAHSPWRGRLHFDVWDDADDTDDDAYAADDEPEMNIWIGMTLVAVGVFLAALAIAGLLRLIEALPVGWRL